MQLIYYLVGIGFLALAKLKHYLQGYQTPKPFDVSNVNESIDYGVDIAQRFEAKLAEHASVELGGKVVLELGPGSDLGTGLALVAHGADRYVAFDRNDLAGQIQENFYELFHARTTIDISPLTDGRVDYITREDFDLRALSGSKFDIVVSNAAFEHFDDVERTIHQLTELMKPDGIAMFEIDLKTHSRWIRDADPNNIYRYPHWLYRMFYFPGQPNRLRPGDYRTALERNGWHILAVAPQIMLDPRFQRYKFRPQYVGQHMDWLSFIICAQSPSS